MAGSLGRFLGAVATPFWLIPYLSLTALVLCLAGLVLLSSILVARHAKLFKGQNAALAVSAVGAMYALIVAGRPRSIAKWAIGVVLVLVGFARLYLGVDHATDIVMGAVFGVAVAVASFRQLVPNELFAGSD